MGTEVSVWCRPSTIRTTVVQLNASLPEYVPLSHAEHEGEPALA